MREIKTLSTIELMRARYRSTPSMPEFLARVARSHGSVVRFSGLGPTIWLMTDPAAVEETLVSKAASFEKSRGTTMLRMLLGRGLLTAEPSEHLVHRRIIQPAFRREQIAHYARTMTASTSDMLDRWRDGEVVDLKRSLNALTLEIASRALLATSLTDREATAFSASLETAMRDFPHFLLPMSKLWAKRPLPFVRRFQASKRAIDGIVDRMVREYRTTEPDVGGVMETLIAARERRGISEKQVRDEALTVLLAGHETTANALTWAFYLLRRHSDVEAELRAHLRDVLDGREPAYEDVPKLDFVRAIVAEALRLYPPAWVITRRARTDVSVNGQSVRAGEIVLVSPYVTQRDPTYWSDPDRFDPRRFSRDSQRTRFAFFPFGGGTRVCIGESFAWAEAILVVAMVVSRFKLEGVGPRDVPIAPLVTLRPAFPILARVERIAKPAR